MMNANRMRARHGGGRSGIGTDEWEGLARRFREERRERGPREADARWVDEPFDDWLRLLDGGCPTCDDCGVSGDCMACDGCDSCGDSELCGGYGRAGVGCAACSCVAGAAGDGGGEDREEDAAYESYGHDCDVGGDRIGCGDRIGRYDGNESVGGRSCFGEAAWPGEGECGGACSMSRRSMAAVVVGMHEALPIRDAILLSLIAGRSCDKKTMIQFVAEPLAGCSRRRMSAMLAEAFEDGEHGPDLERCGKGLGMLLHMVHTVPEPLRAQPLAVIAYVLWWLDNDHAAVYAFRCLTVDGECTLAGIVLSMIERGICPAWCR